MLTVELTVLSTTAASAYYGADIIPKVVYLILIPSE